MSSSTASKGDRELLSRDQTAAENRSTAADATGTAAPVLTVGRYLVDRLVACGVEHVFGIPGDYVLGLYKLLEESPIRLVGTTREDCAGFAADAYARIHGLGCVCVTYCVGGLSTCNSIAGAYAEKSPVIVLSGAIVLASLIVSGVFGLAGNLGASPQPALASQGQGF